VEYQVATLFIVPGWGIQVDDGGKKAAIICVTAITVGVIYMWAIGVAISAVNSNHSISIVADDKGNTLSFAR